MINSHSTSHRIPIQERRCAFQNGEKRCRSASVTHRILFSLFLTLTLASCANGHTPWAEETTRNVTVNDGKLPLSQSAGNHNNKICFVDVSPTPNPGGGLRLVDSGSGLSRTVTVDSTGLFRLVFEAADNWGIAQWYDLVNDPSVRTNLTGPGYGVTHEISTAQPGLFQQVFYGTTPNDPLLYTRAASSYFPNSPRTFNVLENSPYRVVVQAISNPVANAVGVLSNVTADVTYSIYPNGKIYVHSILRVVNAQTASEWRCATLGLHDPTSADPYSGPDSTGWIRSSATQNPYDYVGAVESYIFAYWRASTTPAPHTNFTKASVLLVPNPKNQNQGKQGRHNWAGWKRWYYGNVSLNMAPGQSLTQDYLIQLGTQGSSVLPNIDSRAVADSIAQAYFANPTPPSPSPTPTSRKNWTSPEVNSINDSSRVSAPYPPCWSYFIFPAAIRQTGHPTQPARGFRTTNVGANDEVDTTISSNSRHPRARVVPAKTVKLDRPSFIDEIIPAPK